MSGPTRPTTTAGRARVLPIASGLFVLFLACVAATQFVAAALGYQPALGEPALTLGSWPVYHPHGWLQWHLTFRHVDHPQVDYAFRGAVWIMFAGIAIAALAALVLRHFMTRDMQIVTPDLHGTAQWMAPESVKKSGLIGTGEGVYIGAWQDPKTKRVHYLRHNGPEHVMAIAPTRSGKGVGLILPTLLSWPHSTVVHDIKGEAWAITAGWRKSIGQTVLRFDPADPSGTGVKFNPLDEVRLGTEKEVGDVQNLVTMIVDPDGKGLNDHWAKTGHALLVGAVLHVLYSERNKTLSGVAEFLSDPSRSFTDTLNRMLEAEHDASGMKGWTDSTGAATLTHPVVAASARDMLNKAENEASGVLSTAMSFLTLYRDPIVAANTACSEFRIADLMNAEQPVSLYLVIRPSDKDRLKPLVRLLLNQLVRIPTEHMEFSGGRSVASYKHRLLLMIDEFPSLGRLEIVEEALAFIAGYGMKAYLIAQDFTQLHKHYTRDEAITSNCHVRVAYAPNKYETAKLLSDMLGTTTVVKNQYSYSGKRSSPTLDGISSQVSEHGRALLTPDEIMRLKAPEKNSTGDITNAGEMLIFQAGTSPILGTQILYFLDPTFSERAKITAPDVSDRLRVGAPLPSRAAPVAAAAAAIADPVPEAPGQASYDAPEGDPALQNFEDEDYEHPYIPPDAEIPEHAYIEDPGIDVDDEEPALGAELTLTPAQLATIPDEDDDDDDDADVEGAEAVDHDAADHYYDTALEPIAEPAAVPEGAGDPFLSSSMAWLQTGPLDMDELAAVAAAPAPASEPVIEDVDYLDASRTFTKLPQDSDLLADAFDTLVDVVEAAGERT